MLDLVEITWLPKRQPACHIFHILFQPHTESLAAQGHQQKSCNHQSVDQKLPFFVKYEKSQKICQQSTRNCLR